MKKKTIDQLCCPFDKGDLSLEVINYNEEEQAVVEGILHCATCQRVYPIISGIPIMTPDEYREESLEKPVLEKWQNLVEQRTQAKLTAEKVMEE